jgi:hypothetical protein
MGLFRTKSPEEKAAALAEQIIRSRYISARGDLYDAVFDAANNGGADPQWVERVMPSMVRETAEAWLDVHSDPTDADLSDLWEKDLRTFWNRSYWDEYDTATKDLAQEISVAVQREVVRQNTTRNGSSSPAETRTNETSSGRGPAAFREASEAEYDTTGSSSSAADEDPAAEPAAVGVARAIEVWRWANSEKLSDSARSRLTRIARLVSENAIGSEDVTAVELHEQTQFEQTVADMKHSREMIQHVTQWIAEDPSKFETSLGLYLDGGGASDGLDISTTP